METQQTSFNKTCTKQSGCCEFRDAGNIEYGVSIRCAERTVVHTAIVLIHRCLECWNARIVCLLKVVFKLSELAHLNFRMRVGKNDEFDAVFGHQLVQFIEGIFFAFSVFFEQFFCLFKNSYVAVFEGV